MKKKLLVGILVLTMLAACLGVSALAAAASGATYQEEHDWAKAAASNSDAYTIDEATGKVTLTEDLELDTFVYLTSGSVTVDLAGHNLSRSGNAGTVIAASGTGKLTLTNSGTEGQISGKDAFIVSQEGGTITFNNVKIEQTEQTDKPMKDCAIYAQEGGSVVIEAGTEIIAKAGIMVSDKGTNSLTMTGGKITAEDSAIYTNGSSNKAEDYDDTQTITISGGTIESTKGTAIYLPGKGAIVTISEDDGTTTITGAVTGIEIRSGSLTVDAGTITGGKDEAETGETPSVGGAVTKNAGIGVAPYADQEISVTVTGGKISGGTAFYQSTPADGSNATYEVELDGGEFDGTHAAVSVDDDELKTENFVYGGTFTVTAEGETKGDTTVNEYLADQSQKIDATTGEPTARTKEDEDNVAQVGDTYYGSLTDALDDAQYMESATVTLLDDVQVDWTLPFFSGDITLDLNGKKLALKEDAIAEGPVSVIQVGYGGKLTIDDSSVGKSGSIEATGTVRAIYVTGDDEAATTLVVKGGNIKAASIAICGHGTIDGTDITISGGTVESTETAAIYQPQEGKLTVTGGTIKGKAGIVNLAGELTVSGGTIEATGNTTLNVGDSGHSFEPAAVVVDKNKAVEEGADGYGDGAKANITGGTFKAADGKDTVSFTDNSTDTDADKSNGKKEVTVSGGTFTSGGKADTGVNNYVADNVVVGGDTELTPGKVISYNPAITAGYVAVADGAADAIKAASGDNRFEAADLTDQTIWVTFNPALPEGKTVTVNVKAGGQDYNVEITGNGDFTYTFSPLTEAAEGKENPVQPIVTGTYTVTFGGKSATFEVKAPTYDDVHFAILTGDAAIGNENPADALTVSTGSDDEHGQFVDLTFNIEKLPQTTNKDGTRDYWAGFAVVNPENADKFTLSIKDGKTYSQQELENRVYIDAEEEEHTGVSLYFDKVQMDKDYWVTITWHKSDTTLGTTLYHVVFNTVTFAPPIEEGEDTVVVGKANVVDTGSQDDAIGDYAVTAEWNATDSLYDVTIDATDVTLHYNANGQLGYWVGFSVPAPENAKSVKLGLGADYAAAFADLNSQDPAQTPLGTYIPNNGPDGKLGFSYYLNAGNPELEGTVYILRWFSDIGGSTPISTIAYRISFANSVDTVEPTAPEIYPAITDPEKNNSSTVESVELTMDTAETNNVGYYYEVTLDVSKLSQSTSTDGTQSQQPAQYYTGIAIIAPKGATHVDAKYGTDRASIATGVALKGKQEISLVHGEDGMGVAFYPTINATNLKLSFEWILVQWYKDNELIGTETIHLTTKNVLLQVPNLDITKVVAGFKVEKDAAKKGLEDAIKEVVPGATTTITDAAKNMIYVAFAGTGNGTEVTVEVKKGDASVFAIPQTDKVSFVKDTTKGGYFYYSFDNSAQVASSFKLTAGDYTINLKSGTTVVASATVTINKVTYAKGTEVTYTDPLPTDFFIDANDVTEAALKPASIPEGATCAEGSHLEWVVGEPENGVITVTLTDVKNTPAVSSPTTSKLAKTTNGSAKLSSTTARAGKTVTVTVTPNEGYVVDQVTVTDNNGASVEVTANADGTFTYTVPQATPVTVTVTFKPAGDHVCEDYDDVDENEWYHNGVHYAIEQKLMVGTGTGFEPAKAITRAEAWVILARMGVPGFKTAEGADWYKDAQKYVMTAEEGKQAISDGADPDGNVTREQFVVMLWRANGAPESEFDLSKFTDADTVSDYEGFETAMKWAVEKGYITGRENPDGTITLSPLENIQRGEMATILARIGATLAEEK